VRPSVRTTVRSRSGRSIYGTIHRKRLIPMKSQASTNSVLRPTRMSALQKNVRCAPRPPSSSGRSEESPLGTPFDSQALAGPALYTLLGAHWPRRHFPLLLWRRGAGRGSRRSPPARQITRFSALTGRGAISLSYFGGEGQGEEVVVLRQHARSIGAATRWNVATNRGR
jgi:hypothetical protein